MHNFVYLAQRRSQECSCEPNFGGAPRPLPPGCATEVESDRCRDLSRAVDRVTDSAWPPGSSNSSTRLVQCSQSPAFAALFALSGRARTRRFRQPDGAVANHHHLCPTRSWLQACLPIKSGGLGIRRVSSLALPAYLALSLVCKQAPSAVVRHHA